MLSGPIDRLSGASAGQPKVGFQAVSELLGRQEANYRFMAPAHAQLGNRVQSPGKLCASFPAETFRSALIAGDHRLNGQPSSTPSAGPGDDAAVILALASEGEPNAINGRRLLSSRSRRVTCCCDPPPRCQAGNRLQGRQADGRPWPELFPVGRKDGREASGASRRSSRADGLGRWWADSVCIGRPPLQAHPPGWVGVVTQGSAPHQPSVRQE